MLNGLLGDGEGAFVDVQLGLFRLAFEAFMLDALALRPGEGSGGEGLGEAKEVVGMDFEAGLEGLDIDGLEQLVQKFRQEQVVDIGQLAAAVAPEAPEQGGQIFGVGLGTLLLVPSPNWPLWLYPIVQIVPSDFVNKE